MINMSINCITGEVYNIPAHWIDTNVYIPKFLEIDHNDVMASVANCELNNKKFTLRVALGDETFRASCGTESLSKDITGFNLVGIEKGSEYIIGGTMILTPTNEVTGLTGTPHASEKTITTGYGLYYGKRTDTELDNPSYSGVLITSNSR